MIDGEARLNADKKTLSIVVELTGGLANQLFQWSVGRLLANEFGARLLIDSRIVDRPDGRGEQISYLTTNVDLFVGESAAGKAAWKSAHKLLPRVALGALKRSYLMASRLSTLKTVGTYQEAVAALSNGSSIRMRGLFQCADYLYANRSAVETELGMSMNKMNAPVGEYAAVHIRRGDYVSNAKYNAMFGTCSEAYYRTGIDSLDDTLPVVLVTDDISWAKEFIKTLSRPLAGITISAGTNHFEDLATLAGASELVLSNSTFSWWGAFLGAAGKTVCPVPWFTDSSRDRGLARPEWTPVAR